MLTLKRFNDYIIPGQPRTRVCQLVWTPDDATPFEVTSPDPLHARGHFLNLKLPTTKTWSAIENADDPDKIPTSCTELVMAKMATSQRPALWVEGTELFVHAYADTSKQPWFGDAPSSGRAVHLKGCNMPCLFVRGNGLAASPDQAMAAVLDALGGFEEGKRVPFKCVEHGPIAEVQYELADLFGDDEAAFESTSADTSFIHKGERWTRLDDGSMMVEEVKK